MHGYLIRKIVENHQILWSWCGREDLNLHDLRHRYLKPACLPIPPRPRSHCLSSLKSIFETVFQGQIDELQLYTFKGTCQSPWGFKKRNLQEHKLCNITNFNPKFQAFNKLAIKIHKSALVLFRGCCESQARGQAFAQANLSQWELVHTKLERGMDSNVFKFH